MCYDAVVDSYYLIPAFLNQENVFDSCPPNRRLYQLCIPHFSFFSWAHEMLVYSMYRMAIKQISRFKRPLALYLSCSVANSKSEKSGSPIFQCLNKGSKMPKSFIQVWTVRWGVYILEREGYLNFFRSVCFLDNYYSLQIQSSFTTLVSSDIIRDIWAREMNSGISAEYWEQEMSLLFYYLTEQVNLV